MVAFIPDMVQINIYGLTLAEVLKKGANIPHWLESFGIGDCVVFDVPRSAGQKQLSPQYIRSPITSFNSSIPSSRTDLPPYNEEIKIEEPDNFEHAPDSPARCSTPIQSDADLFNCTISTIHQDRQENELDMRTMEPILEEVEDEPLTVDEHTIAEAERPVLLNLSTSQSNFFKTLFTDSVMDVMIALLDAVVEAQDKPCPSVDVPGNLTEVADQFHSVALQDTLGETSFDSANGGESVLVENEEEAPNKEQSLPESGHTDCPVDQMEVLNSYQQNSFGRESFGAAFDQENFEDADFDYDGDSTMFKDAEEPLPNENNCVTQPIKNPEKINLTGIKINLGRGGNRGPNPISQGDGLRVNVGRSKKAITKDTTIVKCAYRGCSSSLVLRRGYGRDRLVNHVRTHLSERVPWKCAFCDFTALTERTVRSHHGEVHAEVAFKTPKLMDSTESFKELLQTFRICFPGWNANILVADIDPEYLTEATRNYKYLDIEALIKLQSAKRGKNRDPS